MNDHNPAYLTSVSDYRRMENNMLNDIKRIREFAEELGIAEVVTRIDEVLSRVENRTFAVAVVGEFKRGKSTLINALLGKEILPADVLPTSATLNRITYGLTPEARIIFKPVDGEPPREEQIAVEDLVHYVTKLTEEAEMMAQSIQQAVVYYPTKYCRDNADIIDTPGLNDDEMMTAVTMSVIPQIDAAILVILATAPFGAHEADFLNRMLITDLGRVIFVVNRIDEIRKPEDRQRILTKIEERIHTAVVTKAASLFGEGTSEYQAFEKRIGRPRVHGLSAAQALEAKLNNDPALLEKSGFQEFEARLEQFLTEDRGAVTLQIVADSTVAGATRVLNKIAIQENALTMREEEFVMLYQSSMDKLAELEQQYQQSLHTLNTASAAGYQEALTSVGELVNIIRDTVSAVVDDYPMTAQDLKKPDELQQNLTAAVSKQVQKRVEAEAEKIQTRIQQSIGEEVKRLSDLGDRISSVLVEIQMDFEKIGKVQRQRSGTVEGLMAVGGIFFTLGAGVWTGYRASGWKGAAVGGLAGAAAGFGAGFGIAYASIALLGAFPPTLPLALAMAATSMLVSHWTATTLFAADRIERFKEGYKTKMLEEFTKQVPAQVSEMKLQVSQQVEAAFQTLIHYVQLEMGGAIDQTRRTLNTLRDDITRSSAIKEQQVHSLSTMRKATEIILEKARAKSDELREITDV